MVHRLAEISTRPLSFVVYSSHKASDGISERGVYDGKVVWKGVGSCEEALLDVPEKDQMDLRMRRVLLSANCPLNCSRCTRLRHGGGGEGMRYIKPRAIL